MKIKMTKSYQGWRTAEIFLEKGKEYDVTDAVGEYLIKLTRAEPVLDVKVEATAPAVDLATEHNIDINSVPGTGPGGKVTVGDVRNAIPPKVTDAA